MPAYPDARPEWAAAAEAKGVPAPTFPRWVHQRPATSAAPLPVPPRWEPDPWTARFLAAAGPDTPLYGSEEWKALPDADPGKAAAVVRAAAAWAAERDPQVIAARLQTEIAAARQQTRVAAVREVEYAAQNLGVPEFSPARELQQTTDWPAVVPPVGGQVLIGGQPELPFPQPAPAAAERRPGPAQPQPRVPAAYVTAETRPAPAAAAAPVRPVDLAAVVTERARAAAQQQRTPGARDYRQRTVAAGPPGRGGRGR